ncbi:DUF1127 domain-containing protein [Rhizobium sp. CB3090]|uniref:DUF1127 domain-containing protein n=1 Tax=Rhizobium sp. CB3090 TaxID=3039156 RepID=UPI0024B06BE8|nr:DUF1127 domain-containing protein [Rhizobium sp. CB3090]WFU10698.1 DUF1127 domain-containing protein [Rhizobium sp. CB3090]
MSRSSEQEMDTIDTTELSKTAIVSGGEAPRAFMPISRLARRLFDAFAVWLQKRESRWTLRHLTDDELRDIGLTRREAMAEAGKSFFWD